MSHDFFPNDPDKKLDQIKTVLYERLDLIERSSKVKVNDDFNQGVDFAITNELWWLRNLLDKIERS